MNSVPPSKRPHCRVPCQLRGNGQQPVHHGFSLIEVLVSLALSTLLLSAVYSAISMYFHYSHAGQAEVEKNQLARVVLQRIEQDLRSIVYRPDDPATTEEAGASSTSGAIGGNTDQTGDSSESGSSTDDTTTETTTTEVKDPAEAFTGSSSGLFGDTQTLVLHVSRPRMDIISAESLNGQMVLSRTSDLKTVSYFVAGSGSGGLQAAAAAHFATQTRNGSVGSQGLARMEGDRLALQLADKSGNVASLLGQTQMLAPEVTRVGYRYWDGSMWTTQWDSASYGGLPRAVEITIEMDFTPPSEFQSRFKKQAKQEPPRTYRTVVALPLAKPILQPSS